MHPLRTSTDLGWISPCFFERDEELLEGISGMLYAPYWIGYSHTVVLVTGYWPALFHCLHC